MSKQTPPLHPDYRNKYAQMYAVTNCHEVPGELNVFVNDDRQSFAHGAWAVLEELRKDGIIPESFIDKHWKQYTSPKSRSQRKQA